MSSSFYFICSLLPRHCAIFESLSSSIHIIRNTSQHILQISSYICLHIMIDFCHLISQGRISSRISKSKRRMRQWQIARCMLYKSGYTVSQLCKWREGCLGDIIIIDCCFNSCPHNRECNQSDDDMGKDALDAFYCALNSPYTSA